MKRTKTHRYLTVLFLAFILAAPVAAPAVIPTTMNYQGFLTSSGGSAVDGTVTMTFRVYDTATGGTALWEETLSVDVSNGVYSVVLGSTNPLDLSWWAYPGAYLGVTVGTDAEMTPRQELTSVPYALSANDARWSDMAYDLNCTGCVSQSELDFTPGDITSVTAGTGLTGGGTTGNVTLNVDTSLIQNRVTGTCADGSSIRTINQNGTVVCEVDDNTNTIYSAGTGLSLTGTTFSVELPLILSGSVGPGAILSGNNSAANGIGVFGHATNTGYVANLGGSFTANGGLGVGVQGASTGSSGVGVSGVATGNNGIGVSGNASDTNAETNYGGQFIAEGSSGRGVYGLAMHTSGVNYGVYGQTHSTNGYAGYFQGNTRVTGNLTVDGAFTAPGIGDITGVTAGTGLSGGGTSGDVTIDADTTYLQRRVSSSCTEGNSIRVINADGTVTCETDDVLTAHTHSGGEIVSGSVGEAWIDPLIARDAEVAATVNAHASRTDNPHSTTSAQVGAAPVIHSHGAADITSGTINNARFSAYSDLSAEGYLDNSAATDLPTRQQADDRYVNELQANSITSIMIAGGAVVNSKLAANSVGTSQIIDGAVTTAKVSSTLIKDLLGLQLISTSTVIGATGGPPTRVAVNVTCPTGKSAIACGFQTGQQYWHIESARQYQDRCMYALTTCVYLEGGGFVCPYDQDTVQLTATCVNNSAL